MAKAKKKTVRKVVKKSPVSKKSVAKTSNRLSIMLIILAILVFVLAALSMS